MPVIYDGKRYYEDHYGNLYKYASDVPVGRYSPNVLPVVYASERKD